MNSVSQSLLCAVGCGFGSIYVSPRLGRSRGQVSAAGTSLSCWTQGRRAGGSELLQRRRKPQVPLEQSSHTLVMVHMKSFPAAPSSWFAVKQSCQEQTVLPEGGKTREKGKKRKEKKPDC